MNDKDVIYASAAVAGVLGAVGLAMHLLAKKADEKTVFHKDENPTREFKPPFFGAVFLTKTEERILADAITRAGAAVYLHEDVVLDLLARGLVERYGDYKVIATEAGRRAFLRQDS